MNTPCTNPSPVLLAATIATSIFSGCAVSPDYSHYDWAARGGLVEEQDRALASARFEPLQSRRQFAGTRPDEPLTPPGAPTSREQRVVIDPTGSASVPVVERRTTTVVAR